jgi:hypothetical protein
VVNNSIFIVDSSVASSQILVKNLTDGSPNSCLTNTGLDVLGLAQGTIATDIIIHNSTAVVTTLIVKLPQPMLSLWLLPVV